ARPERPGAAAPGARRAATAGRAGALTAGSADQAARPAGARAAGVAVGDSCVGRCCELTTPIGSQLADGELDGGAVAEAPVASERQERCVVWILAWVAGCVDAVGYLTLLQLFTAHVTGITAEAGIRVGEQDWAGLLQRVYPVPLFLIGVLLGLTLTEAAGRRGARAPWALVVGLEAVLLAIAVVLGSALLGRGALVAASAWELWILAPPLVLAMGLQNATIRRVGTYAVRTTFITGMLTG